MKVQQYFPLLSWKMKWVREFGINRYFVIQKSIFGHIERTRNKVCTFPSYFTEITLGLCKHPCSSDEHSIFLVALGSFWKESHSDRLLLRFYGIKQKFLQEQTLRLVCPSFIAALSVRANFSSLFSEGKEGIFFLLESLLLGFIISFNFFLQKYMRSNILYSDLYISEKSRQMKIKRKSYRLLTHFFLISTNGLPWRLPFPDKH